MANDDKSTPPSVIRDYTGILVCAIIVIASIGVGFVQVGIKVFFGVEVTFDPSWLANLSSMASMALGALIQQKVTTAMNNDARANAALASALVTANGNVAYTPPAVTTIAQEEPVKIELVDKDGNPRPTT